MKDLLRFWDRVPAILRAIICFLIVGYAGLLPTNYLFDLNDRLLVDYPWSALAVILFFVCYVAYLAGWGWPEATSLARKEAMSWHRLTRVQWLPALCCMLAAFIFVPASAAVSFRFIEISPGILDRSGEIAGMPFWVALSFITALSVSAGIWEEVAFRGYLQNIVARRHGIYLAIGLSASIFWLAHFNSASGPVRFVTLFVGALMLSWLAYAAKSIIPGVIAHVTSDIFTGLHTRKIINPDYMIKYEPIWKTGPDTHFIAWTVVLILCLIVFVPSVTRLYRITYQKY